MLLGLGRVLGEVTAVLVVAGGLIRVPSGPFESVGALMEAVAAGLGETPGGSSLYEAAFVLGALLFLVAFVINVAADVLVRRDARRRT